MSLLNQMEIYYYVATLNSFSKAATELGLSKGYVSLQITELEKTLGVKLLQRTTRHLSLTDEGKTFFVSCANIIKEQKLAQALVETSKEGVTGKIKISALPSMCITFLPELIIQYLRSYPQINVDLEVSVELKDVLGRDVDVALRIVPPPKEDYVVKVLGNFKYIYCAAPKYLKKFGIPEHPHELLTHNCLIYSVDLKRMNWSFVVNGNIEEINVQGNLISNNVIMVYKALLDGLGITRLPEYVVYEDIKKRNLTRLFAEYSQTPTPIYAIYKGGGFLSPKIKTFIDFIKNSLKLMQV